MLANGIVTENSEPCNSSVQKSYVLLYKQQKLRPEVEGMKVQFPPHHQSYAKRFCGAFVTLVTVY